MSNTLQEDKLRQEILSDAQLKAERCLARAKNDAENLVLKAQKDAAKLRKTRLEEGEAEASEQCRSIHLEVVHKAMEFWLTEREKSLDALFSEAVKQAQAATGAQREASLKTLAKEALQAMGIEKMRVFFNTKDSSIVTRDWLTAIAQELFSDTSDLSFELMPSESFPGGIRLDTLDGRKSFDNSYVSRLEKMKDELRIKLLD